MSLNSLDYSVSMYLNTTERIIQSAESEGKLNERVLSEDIHTFAQSAFSCYSGNVERLKRLSLYGSVSGVLSVCVFGGLFLDYALTKGKNIQSRLAAIALIVSGIGLMILCLSLKTYRASLTKEAFQALQNQQDTNAVGLIAKGAHFNDDLFKLAAQVGCFKSFLYLTLLKAFVSSPGIKSEFFKKDMKEAFRITYNLHIAKVACDLGADINRIFDESNRCNWRQAQVALALGADPTYIFEFADDDVAARLAVAKGADYKNNDAMMILYDYASRERKGPLIAYLNELKSGSSGQGINAGSNNPGGAQESHLNSSRGEGTLTRQAGVETGSDLSTDVNTLNVSNRYNLELAQAALVSGANPTYIFEFAEDVEAARLAVAKGADYKNADVMNSLFGYACRQLKDSFITYLICELGAESAQFGIENAQVEEWNKATASYIPSEEPSEESQNCFKPYQLSTLTFFESYLDQYIENASLPREKFIEALIVFGIDKKEAQRIAGCTESLSLFKEINNRGIRIAEATCKEIVGLTARVKISSETQPSEGLNLS